MSKERDKSLVGNGYVTLTETNEGFKIIASQLRFDWSDGSVTYKSSVNYVVLNGAGDVVSVGTISSSDFYNTPIPRADVVKLLDDAIDSEAFNLKSFKEYYGNK